MARDNNVDEIARAIGREHRRERIVGWLGHFFDTMAIAAFVIALFVAVFGLAGCSFPAEGTGDESSSSDGELPPRWPLPDDEGSSTSSTSTSSSSQSGGATTSPATSSAEDSSSTNSAEDSSSTSSAEDSTSSSGATDSSSSGGNDCAHDLCAGGTQLDASCSTCVDMVCDADPYCCNRGWDAECITGAMNLCGLVCP